MKNVPGPFAGALEWYRTLPLYGSLDEATSRFGFRRFPDSWVVFLTDVTGSTKAIEAGRYKEVNMAGSLPTMAIANLLGTMEFPFVFGGDGMTAILPASLRPDLERILLRSRRAVRDLFDLDLRIGAVPVPELSRRGAEILGARLDVSTEYTQALFWGEGISLAEKLVKGRLVEDPSTAADAFLISEKGEEGTLIGEKADFSGFSCRWKPVPSARGLTLSLLVEPLGPDPQGTLNRILREIRDAVGDEETSHPLPIETQELAVSFETVAREVSVLRRGKRNHPLSSIVLFTRAAFQLLAARAIILLRIPGIRHAGKEVRNRAEHNRRHSDVRKIDGILKTVLSCDAMQKRALVAMLDREESSGSVRYGIHVSDRALMTCFVQDGSGNEVHFVDSDEGGYALAARDMKRKAFSAP